jgi:hypothetical protein
VTAVIHASLRDDHEVRGAGADLLIASGTDVRLAAFAGDGPNGESFDLSPSGGNGQLSFRRQGSTFPHPGRAVAPGHYPTTSRTNFAATSPSSRPISESGRLAPRTRNEWSPPSTT